MLNSNKRYANFITIDRISGLDTESKDGNANFYTIKTNISGTIIFNQMLGLLLGMLLHCVVRVGWFSTFFEFQKESPRESWVLV